MASITRSSVYSKPWLDRPFVLTSESSGWGRYEIPGASYLELPSEEQDAMRTNIRDADPSVVATEFEQLLRLYEPENFEGFLFEKQALSTYHGAKEQVKARARISSTREYFDSGRAAMASAFAAALSAVFTAAKPLHGLNAGFVRYRQVLHGMHLATFADESETYDAAFTPDLVLECIDRDRDWSRVWPPRRERNLNNPLYELPEGGK